MHTLRLLSAANNDDVLTRRRARVEFRQRQAVSRIREEDFISSYRLNKASFRSLCEDIRTLTNLKGTNEISLEVKVLCTLSFLASGSYQRIVGLSVQIAQRSVSRCIQEVVGALNNPSILNKWIRFPCTLQQRSENKVNFQQQYGLPGVVGCIDCTHVAIVRPSTDEHLYFNRKGYHSINVQMVCDTKLRILNVNPKFGGASHDSFIWSSSGLESFIRQIYESGESVWLLGDSGYPQRPWLMTPILNAVPGTPEATYTERQVRARNCIERCFGLLKSRWRCLLRHRTLHYQSTAAARIIIACSVLHNIAIGYEVPSYASFRSDETIREDNIAVGHIESHNNSDLIRGRAVLNNLIQQLN